MSVISFNRSIRVCQLNRVRFFSHFFTRCMSTKNEIQDTELVTSVADVISDNELEKICNKSRLSSGHCNLVNGRVPYDQPVHRFHNTVKYKRRMYGRYGDSSNVNPGLAWPSVQDIEDIREYEKVAYPLTIQEMQQNALARLEDEQKEIQMRQQKIDENMKKLNGWLKEVKEKATKKIYEVQQAKEKKEKLIEEVKKHFGYKMDPKDERFKEMLAKREKEEKKKIRDEKKKVREEKLLNYLKTNETEK